LFLELIGFGNYKGLLPIHLLVNLLRIKEEEKSKTIIQIQA
jgi:hypothetical protein